jgi:hypothetical protein
MPDTLQRRMTTAEFLAWKKHQEARHEFVDGRIRAITGRTRRHNAVGLAIAYERVSFDDQAEA